MKLLQRELRRDVLCGFYNRFSGKDISLITQHPNWCAAMKKRIATSRDLRPMRAH